MNLSKILYKLRKSHIKFSILCSTEEGKDYIIEIGGMFFLDWKGGDENGEFMLEQQSKATREVIEKLLSKVEVIN